MVVPQMLSSALIRIVIACQFHLATSGASSGEMLCGSFNEGEVTVTASKDIMLYWFCLRFRNPIPHNLVHSLSFFTWKLVAKVPRPGSVHNHNLDSNH